MDRQVDSPYAWLRLAVALILSTIGGVGMWSVVVVLPSVQADFGVARADASLPYTLTMLCFGISGILMGRLSDRFGIAAPVAGGAVLLSFGYAVASSAATIWQFALVQGVLIGTGSSATFGPLLADTSQWFLRRRGMAMGVVASGSYLAGAIWPPIVQHFVEAAGWRRAYLGIGIFCAASMLALVAVLRPRAPAAEVAPATGSAGPRSARPLGLAPTTLQILLVAAAVACCVAMSMPQVHLVAYSSDLGHGPAQIGRAH